MTTLKVYDTVLEAKNYAVDEYENYVKRGLDVVIKCYGIHHPYEIKIGDDCYVYAANNPRYLLGVRFDKIEDYTRRGMYNEIRACKYESKN